MQDFFDRNVEKYGRREARYYDLFFITHIKSLKGKTLLDIGGGAGVFAELVKHNLQDIEVTVVDPSQTMLDKINDLAIEKINGELPNSLNLAKSRQFEIIHVSEVIHHIIGNSISSSKRRFTESLQAISEHLVDDGHLMIHELYYESYIIPSLTRSLIFYLLRLQNLFHIQIPITGFLKDLQVCFYTRHELFEGLKKNGFCIIEHKEVPFAKNKIKKVGFINRWGRIMIVAKKV